MPNTIKTERLILRQWQKSDFELFAKLNADPKVMEYFPSLLAEQESDALANRLLHKLEEQRWGLWAVSVPGEASFIGFIGLSEPSFTAHFTPAIEVGWRLAYEFWGKGYATEGALAALQFGFEVLNLKEIVSFTATSNIRSRRVMERIGMDHNPEDDFDHPKLAETHPLRRHVLYRLKLENWKQKIN